MDLQIWQWVRLPRQTAVREREGKWAWVIHGPGRERETGQQKCQRGNNQRGRNSDLDPRSRESFRKWEGSTVANAKARILSQLLRGRV